jgi:hypothetical protein
MMKPSPPKKPDRELAAGSAMPSETPRAAHRKASFWQMSVPPSSRSVHRQDLAGIGRGEGHALLERACVGVDGGEERLARDQALAAPRAVCRSSPPCCALPSPKTVSMRDAGVHEHHAAGLAHGGLAGVESRPRRTASPNP